MINLLFPGWLAGILLSIVAGPLGSFIVWRKMSYFGETLAHVSLLGVALSLILKINTFFAIISVTLIFSLILIILEKKLPLAIDTILGIMAHSALSLGLFVISLTSNIRVDLINYLFGDLLAVTQQDIIKIAFSVVLILVFLIWQWNELLSVTINSELAQVDGVPIQKIKILLILLVTFTIGVAMKYVGALLITSMLIIPAATAQRFSFSPEQMVILAVIINMLDVTIGMLISAYYDTPVGPSIVVTATLIFFISLIIKSKISI
ncbi:MAG: zinc ABC transporter permease subunit ZnuB [Candidatus Dasytiphilus stammeri]